MVTLLEKPKAPPIKLGYEKIPNDTNSTGFAPHYQFATLSTFRDVAARNLFTTIADDIRSGFIPELAYVLCHRVKGEDKKTDRYIDFVKGYFELLGIKTPVIRIPSKLFSDEEYYEYAFDELEKMEYPRDIPKWMIGWMKIIPESIVNKYLLINLHPSGPDGHVGKWEEVMWKSIEEGRRYVEAMIHIATPEMDRGPVLGRYKYPISKRCERLYEKFQENPDEYGEKLFKRFRKEQQCKENALIAVVMKMLETGELRIDGRSVYYRGKLLDPREGILVNNRIDNYMKSKGIVLPY